MARATVGIKPGVLTEISTDPVSGYLRELARMNLGVNRAELRMEPFDVLTHFLDVFDENEPDIQVVISIRRSVFWARKKAKLIARALLKRLEENGARPGMTIGVNIDHVQLLGKALFKSLETASPVPFVTADAVSE